MTTFTTRNASTLWIMLFTVASTVTTLALACATPFPALAALAATQMRRGDGVALMIVAWIASQAVGFCMLDYPHDPKTLAWGVALGMAAVASVLTAGEVVARAPFRSEYARIALAYVVAAIMFKLVILLCSVGLGGVATALSPSINARQLLRNGAILIGLMILYRALVSIGLPALAREPQGAVVPC
jgi:hypothetical protein